MRNMLSFLLAVLLICSACAVADGGFSDDPDAIEVAAKSVLMLEVYDDDSNIIATGSGFVAFNNRTIVTNYHVIEGAEWLLAHSDDGYEYMVTKVLVADEAKDIAVCGFMSPTDLTPLEFGDGADLRRAESIVAIGSPIGITNTVSLGNISAIYEDDGVAWIQFTAPISEGSSGGALFDDDGNVIGVTSASYVDTQNMNMAINVAEVIALYNDRGSASYSYSAPEATQVPTDTADDTSLIRFFEGMEDVTTADEAVSMFESFGFKDISVEGDDGSMISIWLDDEDVSFYGIPLSFATWEIYLGSNTIDEALFLENETDRGFRDATDKLVAVYGTPDFGYIELSEGDHREVRYLSDDEMLYGSVDEIKDECRLDSGSYVIEIYWNNLNLYYDGVSAWLTTSQWTYEDVMSYKTEVYE